MKAYNETKQICIFSDGHKIIFYKIEICRNLITIIVITCNCLSVLVQTVCFILILKLNYHILISCISYSPTHRRNIFFIVFNCVKKFSDAFKIHDATKTKVNVICHRSLKLVLRSNMKKTYPDIFMVFVVNSFEKNSYKFNCKLSLCPNKTSSASMHPNFINAHKEASCHLNNVIMDEGEFSLMRHRTVHSDLFVTSSMPKLYLK